MAKHILGLEIGHTNIKLLECKKKRGELTIEKAQIIPTPADSISDGIINDVQKIYDIINIAIKKKKYQYKNIVMVIKSSEIITRDIVIDAMPKKDMDVVMSLKYEDHLLVDISQYQVTYKGLKEIVNGNQDQQVIQIVAAPNTIIYPLLEIANKLKMRVRAINIASDAITNIFSIQSDMAITNNEEAIMIIDIGGKSTTVSIISQGVGILNRNISFGLDLVNTLLEKEFGLSDPKIIEEFKVKYAGIYDEDAEPGVYAQQISSALKPMIQYELIGDVRKLLQFYFSRNKKNKIEKIYIIGGGAYLKNIDQYMNDLLDIPCVSGVELNPNKVKFLERFQGKNAYFMNILGLVSDSWGW